MKTTLKKLFRKVDLEIKINTVIFEAKISFTDKNKKAAWDMYVEMLTRITTQPLSDEHGDEKTALDSIYSLFPTTRQILKTYGKKTIEFTKVAIPILNQIIRPFNAKWHGKSLTGAFKNTEDCKNFRKELKVLQLELVKYQKILAEIAGVEDLTNLENKS